MNLSWSHGINKMCDRCFFSSIFFSFAPFTMLQMCKFVLVLSNTMYQYCHLPKPVSLRLFFFSGCTIIVSLEPTCICTFELYRFFHFLHSSLNFVCSFDQKSQQKPKLNIGYHPKDIQCCFFASKSDFLPFRICVLDISNKIAAFCNLNLSSAVFDKMSQALYTTE